MKEGENMTVKEVSLQFDKLITSLAGNRYGREIYKKQISEKITDGENEIVVAVLPEAISDVAASFIGGFYSELSEKYGREKAHKLLTIKSNNGFVDKKIIDIRETYGV